MNSDSRAKVAEMVQSFKEGGVTDLVYQKVHDSATGETSYIDAQGNAVSQEQVNAQAVARQAFDIIPEVTAEEIEAEMDKLDEEHRMADKERLVVESPHPEDDEEDEEDDNEDEEDDGDDENADSSPTPPGKKRKLLPSAGPTKSNTTPTASRARPTPPSGHRSKRWSEIKSWKTIAQADRHQECPDNIDELVDDAERVAGKPLKGKYLAIVQKLKIAGYDAKAAELASARDEIERLREQLDKTTLKLQRAKDNVTKLKEQAKAGESSGMSAQKTTKASGKTKSTSATANHLSLPPAPAFRSTMTVPISMMGTISLDETIIDVGVSMMRSTDEQDWSTRAANWVAMAESRPRLEYK
jgi:hypothetical protein